MSKLIFVCLLLGLFAIISAAPSQLNNKVAPACNPDTCKLPDCHCSSTSIPGGLAAKDTPQFVMLTFDDAITVSNIELYRKALNNRKNSDGCPAAATYYVSHEYTDYSLVNELHANGHEIALHSISHSADTSYWREASTQVLANEFAGERTLISHFANISESDMKGLRMPFLQLSGEKSFEMIMKNDLSYDASWPTLKFVDPGLWPYTLNGQTTQDCPIGPCPTESWPGVWVLPMLTWEDDKKVVCAMVDTCVNIPQSVDGLVEFMIRNFNRTYNSNRAPMGFYVHSAWFMVSQNHFDAYVKFLDYLTKLDDVFMVGATDVLKWVKNPIPVQQMKDTQWSQCRVPQNPQCISKVCPLRKGEEERYMTTCVTNCPRVYPWVGNPLGQ